MGVYLSIVLSLCVPTRKKPEILFGLVKPTGCEAEKFLRLLRTSLAGYGYNAVDHSLSKALFYGDHGVELVDKPEEARIRSHMQAGNALREHSKLGDAVVLLALAQIHHS